MSNLFNHKSAIGNNDYHANHFDFIQDETNLHACKNLLKTIFSDYTGSIAIKLWDRKYIIGNDKSECTILFKKQYPLRGLFLHKDLTRLLEAYLCNDISVDGNMELLFSLIEYLQNIEFSFYDNIKFFLSALRLHNDKGKVLTSGLTSSSRKKNNSVESIAHHYDLSNEFYRSFLDPEMVYSCAYFHDHEQSLADAQKDKLDYICRKLRLEPGQELLDIGCGWGGLAIWAAQNYGVRVHGITLSTEQYNYAVARVNKLQLNDNIRIELLDYRDLPGDIAYDKIVSVGMFEHIGVKNFPVYFNLIKNLLKPDGLFLNHGITNDKGWLKSYTTQFINKYIFPDGELARISDVTTSMEDAGFEIIDIEALRPHYVMTLRHWIKLLDKNNEEVINSVGEHTYKLWRLYMSGSAYNFKQGSLGIYQVIACNKRQPWTLPLRREDLYSNQNSSNVSP